MLVLSLA